MTEADRGRLVTLKKAKKKLITQKEAAAEIETTERHVRRLLWALKRRGDKAVIHALRGEPSNRRIDEEKQKAAGILSEEVCRGFRPTLAREHVSQHEIDVSRETVGKWMTEAKLWRPRPAKRGPGACVAATPKPVREAGAVGHQRARLAGRPWRADEADPDD